MTQETIEITKKQGEKILELLEFVEYGLLSESDEKMLEYRFAAIILRDTLKKSEVHGQLLNERSAPIGEKSVEEIMTEINALAVELSQRSGTRQRVFDAASRISIISEKYCKK